MLKSVLGECFIFLVFHGFVLQVTAFLKVSPPKFCIHFLFPTSKLHTQPIITTKIPIFVLTVVHYYIGVIIIVFFCCMHEQLCYRLVILNFYFTRHIL
jgi:hypothetical protein